MGKIIISLVLALIAIQGIQSTFINNSPRNVIGDVGKELKEIIQEVNQQIAAISKELSEKFNEFKNEANFDKIISDLREDISKVDQAEKKCVRVAKEKTSALEFILKHNLFGCNIQIDETSKELASVLKNLQSLAKEVSEVFYTCMKDSNNNHDKFEACLEKKSEDITAKLETLKKSVDDALVAIENSKQKMIDDLKVCIDNVKQEAEQKASAILEDLNKCVGDKRITAIKLPRNVITDVGKELKEIIQEVNQKIAAISKELSEQFNEFKNEANFDKIISDLREDISKVDQAEKKCVRVAKEKTSALEFILKHNLFGCNIQIDETSKELASVLKNLQSLAKEVSEVFYTCMKDSNNNHDKFEACLEKKSEDITAKLETLKKSVDDALVAIENSKQKMIDDLKVCIDNVKQEAEQKASAILEDLNKCVGDKRITAIKLPRNVITDVGKELKEIIQEVNQKIAAISKELSEQFNEFKNEANFDKIISDLREDISKVDQAEKKCVRVAKEKTSALEFILKHNLFGCNIQIDETSKELASVLKNLQSLAKEVSEVFYTCMKDSNNNHDKFEACLEKKSEDITAKLETLKKSVDDALVAIENSKQKMIDDLKVCIDNVKQEAEQKASAILEDLNKCVGDKRITAIKLPRNVITDVGKELKEIIQEVNQKIAAISKELSEQFNEFKNEANFDKIISDLREDISKVDQAEKKCVRVAKEKTSALEFILKHNLFGCNIQIDETSKELASVLKNLQSLAKEVSEVFYTCMKDSNNNHDKFEACLEKKSEDITAKLETLKKSVDDALVAIENSKQKMIDDLKVCIDNVKQEAEQKASAILEDLNKCVGDKRITAIKLPRNVITDVGKELKEIIQEVNQKIAAISKELSEQFNEFKNEANFDKIISDLREDISKVDQAEKKCVRVAKEKTSALEFILKHNLFGCNIQIDETSKELASVLKNLQSLAKEVSEVFYTCMKDSNNNHDKFEACLEKKSEDITAKLETLKKSVDDALVAIENSKQKMIDDLKVCIDNVKQEAEQKASAILEDLNKCVGDKRITAIKLPRNVITDVGKELKEIIQEVNQKIAAISKELSEQFNEFKNEANFDKIISDLREDISKVDQAEKKCVRVAKEKTSALEFILKHNLFGCNIQIDETSKELASVLKNLQSLAKEVSEVFYTCMKDSNNNHDKFEACLEKKSEDITAKLETLKKSVDDALVAIENSKQKMIDDLKVCIDNVKQEAEQKASAILEDLNKCVGDKRITAIKLPRNVITDVGKELKEIIQEVNQKIAAISKELSEQFNEFKNEANFDKIISDLREDISKVDQAEKKCVRVAKEKTSALEFILKHNLFGCNIQIDETSKELASVLKNLQSLAKEVSEVFYTCMKDSNNNHDKFEACLEKKSEDITAKLETLKKSVDDALVAIENSKQKMIDDLKVCIDNVKQEAEQKASAILEDLNKCVGDKRITAIKLPRNVITDVGKELKEIIQEVNQKIAAISKELSEQFNEFKNEANFDKIISDLREDISKVDQAEKKCVRVAKEKTSALEFILKHNLFGCNIQIDETSKELASVLKNLQSLAKEVSEVFYTCMKDSNNNHDKFEACLEKKSEDITAKLETLKKSVDDALVAIENSKQKMIDDLKVCIDNVKQEAEQKASAILEDLNQCIQDDKRMLY